MASTPGLARGGYAARVTRTGLALVHEGELVLPAAGSEAQAEQVIASDRTMVRYRFPVEVQVVTGGGGVSLDRLTDLVLTKLMHAADSVDTD
ncbi:hypothetical protein [Microvirga pakistanensis]|uniref:hypothetical protein n=1 Tax=Microvirga pakistanensis TaxID=1682650 RepID=UPI00106B76FF|nr:hypothetical protein [Microvirga pakistanensis]